MLSTPKGTPALKAAIAAVKKLLQAGQFVYIEK